MKAFAISIESNNKIIVGGKLGSFKTWENDGKNYIGENF